MPVQRPKLRKAPARTLSKQPSAKISHLGRQFVVFPETGVVKQKAGSVWLELQPGSRIYNEVYRKFNRKG